MHRKHSGELVLINHKQPNVLRRHNRIFPQGQNTNREAVTGAGPRVAHVQTDTANEITETRKTETAQVTCPETLELMKTGSLSASG